MKEQTSTIKSNILSNILEKNRFMRELCLNRKMLFSFIILLIFIFLGVLGKWIAPYDPTKSNYSSLLQSPNIKHFFGTDELGRDEFSRLIYGTQITLEVAIIAVLITMIVGTIIGLTAGYFGGIIDNILMRIMDVLLALPGIILAMSIVSILGPSLINAMIAVGIAGIPGFARLTRSATLSVKSLTFVEASKAIGTTNSRILFYQILPNIMGTILVYTTLHVGIAILDTAALSFIGLGAQPPLSEWGSMLSDGKQFITQAWWLVTFPGLAITVVVYACNIFGDCLRDMYDPKLKER
jgi:peptide/nickel transport system permease protein